MNKFDVRFESGHYYTEEWISVPDMFCPHCGVKNIFKEKGEGDYHCGSNHLCSSCGFMFTMPNQKVNNGKDWQVNQRLHWLRSKINIANHYYCPSCYAYGISLDTELICSRCNTKVPPYHIGG